MYSRLIDAAASGMDAAVRASRKRDTSCVVSLIMLFLSSLSSCACSSTTSFNSCA